MQTRHSASRIKLALLFLRRDWRAGELRVLVAALVVAVAAVTSVGFFTDRIQQALLMQANELLGADLILNSTRDIDPVIVNKVADQGIDTSQTLVFPSMVVVKGQTQMSMVKAVQGNFPLRGNIHIASETFGQDRLTNEVPKPGTVWLEPRLMTALHLKVGDEISLGEAVFQVTAVLITEPGRGGDLFNVAPRLLMNLDDIPRTQLLQPGSRVRHQLLMAGEAQTLNQLRQSITSELQVGESIQGIQDARPEMRSALERAERFLGLAAITSVMLAGVAIALAARRFAQRHLNHCAIMRCVGATQGLISQIYALQMIALGLIGCGFGCLLGYFVHGFFVELLGDLLVGVQLPLPSVKPAVIGVTSGMLTLLGFALPPLLQLKDVPALRVIRRDLGALKAPGVVAYLSGAGALSLLMYWQANDLKLGSYMVAGTLLGVVLLGVAAFALVRLLKLVQVYVNGSWRFGLANVARRPMSSVVQVIAFGLGIMALLLLTVIRSDLLNDWQSSLPPEAPNRFVINIQPSQIASLNVFFAQHNLPTPEIYPMIRGRLTAVNGQLVVPEDFVNEHAQRLVRREFNLSWAADLAPDNSVTDGQWWDASDVGSAQISLDRDMAKNLAVKLGDELTYDVAGQLFTAKITSFREIHWDSFRPNFFAIVIPGLLDQFPTTYMTSFHLLPSRFQMLNELVEAYPNITVIDVAAIMEHVRNIISRVTLAVEYVFLFTLLSGVMVLYAGIQATHDERLMENAVIRTLGGRRHQIIQALWAEFICLGVLAGLLASILASVLAYVIASQVLKMDYTFDPMIWFFGVFGGAIGVAIAGLWGSRKVMSQPPLQTLREVAL